MQRSKNKTASKKLLLVLLILPALLPLGLVDAQEPSPTPETLIPPSPAEVINAVNELRLSRGLRALAVHPILMQIAQDEANGIASGAGGHWRPKGLTLGQWLLTLGYPLSGDLSLDGYRSENWGVASTAEEAINMWLGDDPHTNTMLSPNRSDIGAGIAVSDQIYIVIETALQTSSGKMQYDAYAILTGIPGTQAVYSSIGTQAAENGLLPQYSMPVALSTALPDGDVYHEVLYGQTLWSIAIAYNTTIKQIQQLNNLYDININVGQKLLVLKGATQPAPSARETSTPTITATEILKSPIAILSKTPTPQPTRVYTEKDRQKDMFGIGAIALAAIFLGGLFTVMTKRKPL